MIHYKIDLNICTLFHQLLLLQKQNYKKNKAQRQNFYSLKFEPGFEIPFFPNQKEFPLCLINEALFHFANNVSKNTPFPKHGDVLYFLILCHQNQNAPSIQKIVFLLQLEDYKFYGVQKGLCLKKKYKKKIINRIRFPLDLLLVLSYETGRIFLLHPPQHTSNQ